MRPYAGSEENGSWIYELLQMGWSLAIKSFGTEGFHIPSWGLQAAGAERPVQQKYAGFFFFSLFLLLAQVAQQ